MLEKIKHKIDTKTKPIGALGQLEAIATKVCLVQNTLQPHLKHPTILVFAADHGIAQSGVSAYPKEVTAQMVINFLNGGAAINVFCRQHGIALKIVDAGVDFDFEEHPDLIDAKVGKATQNYLLEPAMTPSQLEDCFGKARQIVNEVARSGCNVIGFGEMGIGNTSSASLLMSVLCDLPIEACVGRGTGLTDDQLSCKTETLGRALHRHPKPKDVRDALTLFGGFEIAQICGSLLAAYEKNMLLLIDGFIATAAYLCAYQLHPAIHKNAVFCHQSDEQGHQRMLDFLGARPLLQLGLRLGEGTGCAVAYPILESAVRFVNEMSSFSDAGVSNKELV